MIAYTRFTSSFHPCQYLTVAMQCCSSARHCRPWQRSSAPALRSTRSAARSVKASAVARSDSEAHLQLATAKLPSASDAGRFADAMYQWAATLTQNGANLPFALPLKADKVPSGFQLSVPFPLPSVTSTASTPLLQISLLKRSPAGGFDSAGDILGTVEPVPNVGNVLFVRFFEGPVAQQDRRTPPAADATERLEAVLGGLVDVDVIMGTMPGAIRKAVAASCP